MQIFDQNHGLTPLKKMLILSLFKFDIYIVWKGQFFYLERYGRLFMGLFNLKNTG